MNFLTQCGANASMTDSFGKNALQVVLQQSYFKNGYINKLEQLYPHLLTENIKVKVDDRLVKIDNHKIEYFLVNLFIALQGAIIAQNERHWTQAGVTAKDIEGTVADYPEIILLDYRKKRTYLSSNLSKNEINGSNPYNKKLFYRISRGYYVLNPGIDIMVNDNWKNVYDLMRIEKPEILTPEEVTEKLNNEALEFRKKFLSHSSRYNPYYEEDEVEEEDDDYINEWNRQKEEYERRRQEIREKNAEIKKLKKQLQEEKAKRQKQKEEAESSQLKLGFD